MYDNYKVKPLHIMLPKVSAYVKSYDGETKWMYFWLKIITNYKNIILLGIKSALILKKEFEIELVYHKNFLKTKIKYHGDKVSDCYDK